MVARQGQQKTRKVLETPTGLEQSGESPDRPGKRILARADSPGKAFAKMIAINRNTCEHERFKKAGMTASGKQRYKCKGCGARWTGETRLLGGMRIGLDKAEQIIKALSDV